MNHSASFKNDYMSHIHSQQYFWGMSIYVDQTEELLFNPKPWQLVEFQAWTLSELQTWVDSDDELNTAANVASVVPTSQTCTTTVVPLIFLCLQSNRNYNDADAYTKSFMYFAKVPLLLSFLFAAPFSN